MRRRSGTFAGGFIHLLAFYQAILMACLDGLTRVLFNNLRGLSVVLGRQGTLLMATILMFQLIVKGSLRVSLFFRYP